MELCLGTVQLGMDYGIRGKRKPVLSDSLKILDYAIHNGITAIDTANAYGEAENVVGAYIEKNTSLRRNITLISKLRPNLLDNVSEEQNYPIMRQNLEGSLRRLHTDYLDGYLLHSSRYVFNEAMIDALLRLKSEGLVKAVGVSVYEPDEAKAGISNNKLDFLQLPYSVLDQRMLQSGVFDLAKEKRVTLHSRSAFIQGLILMKPEEVPPFLSKRAVPILQSLDEVCSETGLTRLQLAIGFVKRQASISHLVFGVRNLAQLREDISVFQQSLPDDVIAILEQKFQNISAGIVMPSLWAKN